MGDKNLVQGVEKRLLDKASFVVTNFRPGVGAEQVKAGERVRGKQPFQRVMALESEDFDIGESEVFDFPADTTDPTKQALNAYKITIRKVLGHFN